MADERPVRGFAHHHTDEELRAYAALTPEQKLRWLHEAWRFTADFLPAGRREAWMKMRRGEISGADRPRRTVYATCAESFNPSARVTLRTVSNRGFAPGASAL